MHNTTVWPPAFEVQRGPQLLLRVAGTLLRSSCSHKEDENNRETTRNYRKGRKICG